VTLSVYWRRGHPQIMERAAALGTARLGPIAADPGVADPTTGQVGTDGFQ